MAAKPIMVSELDGTDRAGAVRPGEELDLNALSTWLAAEHPELAGSLELAQFAGGYSNLTYLLTVVSSEGERRELVLRRPPFGSDVRGAHDMGREHRVLAALADIYPKAPRPLFLCEDPSVLGAPFYAMERREGIILRADGSVRPPPPALRSIDEALVETLAELHAVDYRAAGLADLGRPAGYVERQVEGWSRRWTAARTEEVSDMESARRWLTRNRPASSGATLVHNDFKHDNLVLSPEDPSRVVAVLDWEMTTLGEPLMDLGTTLAYWVEPGDPEPLRRLALSPTVWPGGLTRSEVARHYAERTGRDLSDLVFYYAFGLFKVAVIIQQIYYRFRHGLTADPRFAGLGEGVEALAGAALRAIETGALTSSPGGRR